MEAWHLWHLATRLVIAVAVVAWGWGSAPVQQLLTGIAGAWLLIGALRPRGLLTMLGDVLAVSVLQFFSPLWLPLGAWVVVAHRSYARSAAALLIPVLVVRSWVVDSSFVGWALVFSVVWLSLAHLLALRDSEEYEPLLPLPDDLREQWEQEREAHRQLRFQYQQLAGAHRELSAQRHLERTRLQILRSAIGATSLEEVAQHLGITLREHLDAMDGAIWIVEAHEPRQMKLAYTTVEDLPKYLEVDRAKEQVYAALPTVQAQVWNIQDEEGVVGFVAVYHWKSREAAAQSTERFQQLREVVALALRFAIQRQVLLQESRILGALYEIGRLFLVSQSVEDSAQQFVQVVSELVHAPFVTLYLYSPETGRMEETAAVGYPIRLKEVREGREREIVEWVVVNARPLYLPQVSVESGLWQYTSARQFASLVGVPLFIREQVGGVLLAAHSIPHYFTEHHVDQLAIAASQFAQVVERMHLTRSVGLLALTDGLTGVFNRRYMEIRLEEEIRRCQRSAGRFCIILIDVDHFKQINDTLGHATGDVVLQEVSRRVKESIRETDMLFRYGGEEFLVMLPETVLAQAMNVAQRVRQAVQERPFRTADGLKTFNVTLSAGVAEYPTHGAEKTALLDAADQALYRAKQSGRNRVEVLPAAA